MENDINEVLEKSSHLSESDKEIWGLVLGKLQRTQEKMFEDISNRIRSQMNSNKKVDNIWNIVTSLIEKSELENAKKNDLYEVCKINSFCQCISYDEIMRNSDGFSDTNIFNCGIAFLKCSYPDIVSITNKEYIANVTTNSEEYEIVYKILPFNGFHNEEEKLERVARQYGVSKPIIFSPFSRRAINVLLDFGEKNISKSDNIKIDFMLEKNNLHNVLLCNKTLVWNVETIEKHEIPRPKENINKQIIPLFENVYYIYEFITEENEFIYFETQESDIKRYGDTIYVGLNKEQSLDSSRYSKYIVHNYIRKFLGNNKYLFENFYNMESFFKERIRTEADIEYVLGCFRNSVVTYEKPLRNIGNNKSIHIYESRDAYYYDKKAVLRGNTMCYLLFKKSESLFFEDYISYILAYMNYRYPEFYWVGVV